MHKRRMIPRIDSLSLSLVSLIHFLGYITLIDDLFVCGGRFRFTWLFGASLSTGSSPFGSWICSPPSCLIATGGSLPPPAANPPAWCY